MVAGKISKTNNNKWRARFVLGCLLLACAVIVGRLYYLQVILGEQYRVWAQGLQSFSGRGDLPERGEIFFAGGQPLAINKDFYYAYASPLNVTDKKKAASRATEILGLDENNLQEKLNQDLLYVVLKEKISDQEAQAVKNIGLEGVYLGKKRMRYYPQGNVASQIVGFVNNDGQGRYGLEEYYDEKLAKGESIILNIDYNIQYQTEKILATAKDKLNAIDGEAIIANPKTGAILAMAKTPNFNPNNYRDYAAKDIDVFKNDSCQTLFEPGSVFKAVTMASVLNDGKVTPETQYYDAGILKIGGLTIYNYGNRSYGYQTMTNVLEYSINTGAVFAAGRLGNQALADYIEKFGIFDPTGIDLSETFSSNNEFKKGYEIGYATASFGQGIWMTSIQLIKAYSALANGGWLLPPSIVKEGRAPLDDSKKRQVISKETSETISKMLASVVDNGFGKKAKVPGYAISGKTGTAQMSWSTLGIDQRGYSDKTTQSFVGFFPSDDPKFLILVKFKAPNVNTAEYSAIPVFNELARYVIYAEQLPPTEDIKKPTITVVPASADSTNTSQNSAKVQPQNTP